MSYASVFDQLNADCLADRTVAVGVLYERHFENFRRRAFRSLKSRQYAGDALEQATDLALDAFERILKWAVSGKWPSGRTSAPWTNDDMFEAYWFEALDMRAISACKSRSRTVVADSQTDSVFEVTQHPQEEPVEIDYTEIIARIHQAAFDILKDRHLRVIPVMAKEYAEFKGNRPLAELYAEVAQKSNLGSAQYVANCWSAGVSMVKELIANSSNKLAADLLVKAALDSGFPTPRCAGIQP